MSGLYGNATGGFGFPKTFLLTDSDGNEITGVVVGEETIFDATKNDVREGKTFAGNDGVATGTKVIPAYHTTETELYIENGEDFIIPLSYLDLYDYTKLQVIICKYNTSMSDSVSAQKISILDKVFDVNSTTEVSSVTKDAENKSINLGITNNSGVPCVLRVFTYKEID